MALLRQLLLLPVVAPLLVVLLVGAFNPRPAVSLRLLIWNTPTLPIGIWLLLASGGGGLLSAAATSLALRSGDDQLQKRRQLRRAPDWPESTETQPQPSRRDPSIGGWGATGPSRAPGDPPPTVAVPFRVIRRPASAQSTTAGPTASGPSTPAMDLQDDWGLHDENDW